METHLRFPAEWEPQSAVLIAWPHADTDWAERLAGVMAPFRPGGVGGPGAHLGYSPWCRPTVIDGVKCVVVNRALREHEPMAWDFVMNFARDNDLQTVEACLLSDAPASKS